MKGRILLWYSAGYAVAVGLALGACGDDGTSGGGGDTTQTTDVVDADTAVPPADTTTSPGDTQTGTDTTQPPTDTQQPPDLRMCSDAELQTFNACVDGCATQACQQGCMSDLSASCENAYRALLQCANAASCGEDLDCIVQNCRDEVEAVFGAGSGVEPSDCDPVTNGGCAANQNCTIVAEGLLGCAPAGTAGYGEACGEIVGCVRGACLTFDNVSFECTEFCDPDNNQCREGRPCNQAVRGFDLTFCGDRPTDCDIFTQDCAPPLGCYFVDLEGRTDCSPHAGKQRGASCAFVNDCAPGMICSGPSASATCEVVCNTDGSTPCASGTCSPTGIGNIGVCI